MIRKELDPFESDDKYARAGRAAEEQMAFYLKRFFERKPDIHILNGIRLEQDGDAAQMDHLILHPYGVLIVESKSVQGKIQIKDDGQWIRWYGEKQSKGMASPVTQARLQAEFLKTVLGRAARSDSFFDVVPFDTLVAISDKGVILWPKSGPLSDVCKADQVPEKLTARISALAQPRSGVPLLSPENTEKIVQFLTLLHRPLHRVPELRQAAEPVAPIYQAAAPKALWSCKHCGSENLEIRYAHTYFFYCLDCQKNTAIKPGPCAKCGEPERIRKQGLDYFFDCKKCGTSRSFYFNRTA